VLKGARAVNPDANDAGSRDEAILSAVDTLQPGDRLLIAGKGHETGQVVGKEILPFDDAEQARAAVAALDGLDQWEDAE
jgi:UDP-N-acetylmuramoyl-L-alanyl-D-glutamate--2,6-diaminopimelate ligase